MKLLKKLSAILLAIVLLFGSMPMADLGLENLFSSIAFAAEEDNEEEEERIDTKKDYVYGDFIYGYTKSDEIVIRKYMGKEKTVLVPETIEGKLVTGIGYNAFCSTESYTTYYNKTEYSNPDSVNIESVKLPDSINEICAGAFDGCKNLKSINMPANLSYIDEEAFQNCSSLENLEFSDQLTSIGGNAFSGTKIKSMNIVSPEKDFVAYQSMLAGSAVENISIKAKSISINSKSLKSEILKNVKLEGRVTIKENGIVSRSLETITLSGTVGAIATDAIACQSLKTVTIDCDLTGCSTAAFGFSGEDTLPDTVVVNNCFSAGVYDMFEEFLDYVGEVTFTDTVKQIVFKKYVEPTEIFTEDVYQYYINENDEAVIYKYTGKHKGTVHLLVPETLGGAPVTVIGRRAFEDLESDFEFIYLPDTVTRIENNAFAGSKKISTIRISPNLESIGCRAFRGMTKLWAVGTYDSYEDVVGGEIKLPDTITFIPTEAFRECGNLLRIQANGVTAVFDGAFRQSGMNNTDFSEDFYWVGDGAFYNSKVKQFNHDKNVTHLGKEAFYNSSLTEFELNETLTEIPDGAFYSTDITGIVIPSGIETIGDSAFSQCALLKNVEMSDSVTTIGESAFYNCKSLKTVSLPKALTVIETSTFENCESLESIKIPNSVTTIGEKAFYNCKALLGIEIPDSVTTIDLQTFENCSALKTLKLSNSLERIERRAFYGCSALEHLEIPDSVISIGIDAFSNCSALKGELTIPLNIQAIGSRAFYGTGYSVLNYNVVNGGSISHNAYKGMKNLITIKIGDNVTEIPEQAFQYLDTVKEVIMSDSVEIIGSEAFCYCDNLERVKMSKNLTRIDIKAFYRCPNLTEINIPESLNCIDDSAFYGCSQITEFTLPKNLTYLGNCALPQTLTTLYYNAENLSCSSSPFNYTSVSNIVFSDKIKRIPYGLLSEIKTIESLTLPDSITEIGEKAFYKSSIKSIKLSSGLIVIENSAFAETNIKIEGNALPDGLRIIGENAFQKNNGIEEIYIPDSVVDIADSAFDNCTNLKKVRMSSSVKLIASNAFYNCTSLEEFIWDSDVKLIADYAFYNCKALKDFNFAGVELVYPNSFTNSGVTLVTLGHDKNDEATDLIMIETQSFMGCENLDTVAIGGNVTTIKSEAFASCSSLETVIIADSVVNIAGNAFDDCSEFTIYCEEGSYAQKFAEKKGIPVSTFVVAPIPNQTYTGSEIEPKIDVSVSGEKVMENTDFSVKYSNNINVGTAKVTVSGKGAYKVLSSIANFTIITKSIAPVTFATISEQDYTGEAVIPTLTVTDGNRVLKEGVDYTVTYKNNVEEGTATATIQGIGNYHGTASTSFQIRELSTSQSASNKILDFFTSLWLKIVSFFTSIFN